MTKCQNCGFDPRPDQRAGKWRARFRLYREGQADPYGDSDDGIPADAPGLEIYDGLPEVAAQLHAMALHIHGQQTDYGKQADVTGLEMSILLHKLKGLRPTISRRGGNATWRVPYTAGGQSWLARVDVVRVG